MPFVLMKIFEQSPGAFDFWLGVISLGRLERIRRDLLLPKIRADDRILEIGCGTGTLAAAMAARGAEVVAIDASERMLAQARQRAATGEPARRLSFQRMTALEIEDRFAAQSFDQVVSVLTLSELSEDEVACVLEQSHLLLRAGGRLLLLDEVEPESWVRRWLFRLLRYPARLVTFLVLQAVDLKDTSLAKRVLYYVIELPLMLLAFLVVPAPTRPLSDPERRLEQASLRVVSSVSLFGGALKLIEAERPC